MRVYGFLEEVRFSHPLLLKTLESLVFTGFRAFSFFRLKVDLIIARLPSSDHNCLITEPPALS